MDPQKWRNIVEAIGLTAVVLSLVLVAYEVRQNQETMVEANLINRLDARTTEIEQYNDFRSRIAENGELAEIWIKGLSGADLTEVETARFHSLCGNNIWTSVGIYERSLALNRVSTALGTVERRAQLIRENPGFRDCWNRLEEEIRKYGLASYVDEVNQHLNE